MDRVETDYNLDCGFARDSSWFRLRAAAVIIEDGCVLMVGNDTVDYLYTVGGAVHLGETAEKAVVREVREETGIEYEVERLIFIHENFFRGQMGVLADLQCHEVAFYFLMKPRGTQELESDSYGLDGKEFMQWVPLAEFTRHKAYPAFFAEKLLDLPDRIEHIVTIKD